MIHTLHEPLPRTSVDEIGKSDRPRVLVMGGGGIAPGVVTATLSIVLNLLDKGYDPVGLVGSWEGVQLEGKMGLIDFARIPQPNLVELFLRYEGGTCLGPGRGMLKRDEFIRMRRLQDKVGFIGTAVVGGDGTLSGSQALNYSVTPDGRPVANTVGGIKTIDVDAEGSLAIGFQTSAHEYARAIQAMMREIEWEKGIGVVGVYGRDNGHLALHASALAVGEKASCITLVPEFPISRQQFLDRVYALKQQHGYVCIVASEGFAFEGESQMADMTRRDGAGNAKLLGCTDLIQEIIAKDPRISTLGKYSLRVSEPAILTRSCDPVPADQKLATHVGQAVADVIERGGWGHAVLMQGSFHDGFRPVVQPLWSVHTGNPVESHAYDAQKLQPTHAYRHHIAEQNPRFHKADYSGLEEQKRVHEDLIRRIARGNLVEHNGVLVPDWAIQEETDREKPTLWHGPLSKMQS